MIPEWLGIALAVIGLIGPWIAGYFGVQRGMSVGLAVHAEQIKELQTEVAKLRTRYHDRIAPMMTEHEAWLDVLKKKAGVG